MSRRKNRFLRWLLIKVPLFLIFLSLVWVLLLKWVPVLVTPLMLSRSVEYRTDDTFHTYKKWVPLEKISPEMVKAVIASEDNLFPEHKGFDWNQIRISIEEHRDKGKKLRGASTISQQTAKNVFLFPSRNLVRKGLEAYFTVLIEWIWGKERIMEVYLNVIETGRGLYGAEAAAQKLFDKNASDLTKRESCLITACLPSPLTRDAAHPSEYVKKRASRISVLEGNLLYPEWVTER